MLVRGSSGIVFDVDEQVATSMIASGILEQVPEDPAQDPEDPAQDPEDPGPAEEKTKKK